MEHEENRNVVDGRALARAVLARAQARAETLPHKPRVIAIVTSDTLTTNSYLSIKEKRAVEAGCTLEIVRLSEEESTAALRAAVLHASERADAVIVQLPLSAHIDTKAVCDFIPLTKDADVLSSLARENFKQGSETSLVPPVAGAVREIFSRYGITAQGKRAVVVGDGWLVGNPCAMWLAQQGARVTVITARTGISERNEAFRTADVIVSGAGSPHCITPDPLKDGVVLIDAGTSESAGKIAGDADPSCIEKCSLFTPVPGGVGPLAVACLFENVVTLACRAQSL